MQCCKAVVCCATKTGYSMSVTNDYVIIVTTKFQIHVYIHGQHMHIDTDTEAAENNTLQYT